MLLFLGIITFVVFVHEFGHYIVAKATGIPVKTFSIGFGPKLLGFNAFGTNWRISLIPLGGYVRLQGDDDYENKAQNPRSFWGCHPWRRIAIALAGPAINLALPLALFFGYYWGQRVEVEHETDRGVMVRVYEVDAAIAWKASKAMTADMYSAIGRAVNHIKKHGMKKEDLGGPVAIYDETQKAAKRSKEQNDWGFLIQWIAFFSINLGIMNLLPIPLLDGGHVTLSSYEWATGKNISLSARSKLHFVGLLFVCALMAFAIYSDVVRLWG